MSVIDLSEITTSEDWELFAADFFHELGFRVVTGPDRGPDGGRDIILVESLSGELNKYSHRWLVSCKHFIQSGKAVGVEHETNITDRLKHHRCESFIGFYSTIQSAAISTRLDEYLRDGVIKDYKIFNSRLIENYLVRKGYSKLLLRFLPESYKRLKPIHQLYRDYSPIECAVCGKDLLELEGSQTFHANVIVYSRTDLNPNRVEKVVCVCKDPCDRKVRREKINGIELDDSWDDLSDMLIPINYVSSIMAFLNDLYLKRVDYSKAAFEQYKQLLLKMAQKVMREMTEEEEKRTAEIRGLRAALYGDSAA